MASNIWLSNVATGLGLEYCLSGSTKTEYTGSGSPWNTQSTTPYRIAMNDVTGPRWTPQAAPAGIVFGGGAPFFDGAAAIYEANGDLTETVPIQCYANSFDNAMFLVRQLRFLFASIANFTWPMILAVQPNGSTNTSYFEIKAASIQEDPRFINDEAGRNCVRALITWTRSPFALPTSLKTLINNAVFTNIGTGSNNNAQSLGISVPSVSTTDGDRVYAGEPMNLKLANGTSSAANRIWLASVLHRVYTSVNTSKTTTTSTDWALSAANVTLNSSTYYQTAVKGRLLARFTTFTQLAKAQFQGVVYDSQGLSGGLSAVLLSSKKIAADNTGASSIYIDFGWFDLSLLRRQQLGTTAPKISVQFYLYSTDGTSVTATLDYFEVLQYYDFCRIDALNGNVSSTSTVYVEQVNNLNQEAYALSRPPIAYATTTSDDQPHMPAPIRGRLPRAFAGASLFVAWINGSYVHDKTNTIRVTAQLAPLYGTMRGSG